MAEDGKLRGYFVHNQQPDGSGVDKKVHDQIDALGKHFEMKEVLLSAGRESWLHRKIRMKVFHARRHYKYHESIKEIEAPDFVYARKQFLDDDFFWFLQKIKEKNDKCRIFIEMGTYPYMKELVDGIRTKKQAEELIRMEEEGGRILPQYADRIITFYENEDILGIKTICTTNGINVSRIRPVRKAERSEEINLMAVAKFQPSHAYERIIDALIRYYENGGEREIILHMVGDGIELPGYKKMAEAASVSKRIIFYGQKTGEELDKIYDKADIGLGCFGYYKRGIDVSSPIKTREYVAKGLPIVYAAHETCFDSEKADFALELANDGSPLDINDIISFYDGLFENGRTLEQLHRDIREYAKRHFDMEITMMPVIKEIKEICR